MVNLIQDKTFLLFGISTNKSRQAEVPYKWVLNKTDKLLKLVIPFDLKNDILDELNLLGFNHSTLFPEIENQGQHLKELYQKKI